MIMQYLIFATKSQMHPKTTFLLQSQKIPDIITESLPTTVTLPLSNITISYINFLIFFKQQGDPFVVGVVVLSKSPPLDRDPSFSRSLAEATPILIYSLL